MPLVIGAAAIPLMGRPLLFLPIHIVWLELVIHPTAMLAFQDLPAQVPLAQVQRHRRARFFSATSWLGIVVVGGVVSVAVVWSYVHAFGPSPDAEHARAMALAVLLAASAGITIGLTRLREVTARWLVAGTLVSLGVLVQVPAISGLLDLRPLHRPDWLLVAVAFTLVGAMSFMLATQLKRHLE